MESINTYLSQQSQFNVEGLIKFIYSQMPKKSYHSRIHYRKYSEDNLIQIFTESSQDYSEYEIFNACRSIVIDTINNKIVSYSHPNIKYVEYNKELLNNNQIFTESHEGTLISIFYFNNKWYYGTRRQLDMYKTNQVVYGQVSELSHGQMFEDALNKLGMSKTEFESTLSTEYQYYVELVHYQNSFNIKYTSRYGDKYAKLFLLFVKNKNNEIITDVNSKLQVNEVIDYTKVISTLEDSTNVTTEGFIFNNNNELCKVMHSNYYAEMKFNPGFKTKQEQYIYLYQKDLLNEYATKYNNTVYKVTDQGENVEIVGILACIFTYVGQRMLDIYYKFNNNNMVHRNEDIFKNLFITPTENKNYIMIFHILGMMKGIHKNKPLNINEMRKFLKYRMSASDIWKLIHEISEFEEKEKLLTTWTNPLVKMFL